MTDLDDATRDALTQVIQDHDGGMLNRYVLIAETIETDGERGIWVGRSEGQQTWESLGLLDMATQFVRKGMDDG